ncbi:MAG: hypothetical protein RLZZ555_547 [Pseudomonadota bacterium]|jgi:Domain of unknown function (DUF4123)
MMAQHTLQQRLWSCSGLKPWVVLDGAGVPGLLPQLAELPARGWTCLFQGELDREVAELAPYLVEVPTEGGWLDWLSKGWGCQWGVYLLAPDSMDLAALRRHLRKLGMAYGPAGEPLWFRWYDPRVLRQVAPGFDAAQLQALFGSIHCFLLEGEQAGRGLVLERTAGRLAMSRF